VINLIMIAISAIVLALLLLWLLWPEFRAWIEAPKYFMLRQVHRFNHADRRSRPGANPGNPE
jgi:hypothetical protein